MISIADISGFDNHTNFSIIMAMLGLLVLGFGYLFYCAYKYYNPTNVSSIKHYYYALKALVITPIIKANNFITENIYSLFFTKKE